MLVHLLGTAGTGGIVLDMLGVLLQLLRIHLLERLQRELDVLDQGIASGARKVFADDNTHHLEALRVRGHGVGGDNPATLPQLVSDCELVKSVLIFWLEAESYEREAFAVRLGHELEAKLLHGRGEIVGRTGKVQHDAAVAALAQADQLVVLPNDLGSTAGEVESKGSLVRSEVVDVEDELFGEVLGVAPNRPTDTRIHQTVLVAGDVDADDLL